MHPAARTVLGEGAIRKPRIEVPPSLIDDRKNGATIRQLAEKYPTFKPTTIATRLNQLGIVVPPRPSPNKRPEPFPNLAKDYREGDSIGDLARKHGVSQNTISAMLKELGVERRPRGN